MYPTDMLKPEVAWESVDKNNKVSPFVESNTLTIVHNAIKEFAELCSVEVWGWARTDLSTRPYNKKFEQAYLFMAREILEKIQILGDEGHIRLRDIYFECQKRLMQGVKLPSDTIEAVCLGNTGRIGTSYGPNTRIPIQDYLSDGNRVRIVNNFIWALRKMMENYGEERVTAALRESPTLTDDKGKGMGH